MRAAPAEWVNWKAVLLRGVTDPTAGVDATAAELGRVLATWHDRTWHNPTVVDEFDDYEAFEQLRISPYHRAVAAAHPSAVECAVAVRGSATRVALARGHDQAVLVVDEGGLGLPLESNRAALDLLTEAIERAGLALGLQMTIGIDLAARDRFRGRSSSVSPKRDKRRN